MLVTRGSDEDFVKVLDFGIAKLPTGRPSKLPPGPVATGPLTKSGTVFGTPEYMAPEQAIGQTVDGRADLYALGVIAYEMMGGVRPFSSNSEQGLLGQQLAKPVPPFSERAPGLSIPHQVEQFVHKLLAKDVEARYQTADETVQACDELLLPTPGGEGRVFTIPDGSATAFLGTADEVYAPPPNPFVTPAAPETGGPGGTLLVLDESQTRKLAERTLQASSPLSPTEAPWQRTVTLTKRTLNVVGDFIDDNRPRLPERIRHLLRKVPALVIFAVLFVIVWGAMFIGLATVASLRGHPKAALSAAPSTGPSAQAPTPDPVLKELDKAKVQGHATLQKLAEQHPKHPQVLFALAASHAARNELGDAVSYLGKALAIDPTLGSAPESHGILVAAVRDRKSSEAAFPLLEGPMGKAGAAILYDLSIDQKASASLRSRAQKWVVLSPDFLKVASPSVKVAAQLRYARSCTDRHKLMARAGEVGDERALAYLKILKYRKGCGRRGRSDCFPCLRQDKALEEAAAKIEKRIAKPR